MFKLLKNQRGDSWLAWIIYMGIGVFLYNFILGDDSQIVEKATNLAENALDRANSELTQEEETFDEEVAESPAITTELNTRIDCQDGKQVVIHNGNVYVLAEPDEWGDLKPLICGGYNGQERIYPN